MSSDGIKDNVTDSESIYLVDDAKSIDEMERAIGISVMGVDGDGGGVFSYQPGEGQTSSDAMEFKEQWLRWLREVFRDQLAETFIKVYLASSEMRIRRMVELDNQLDQRLSLEERERSRQAGSWFLEGKSEMQRAPQWQKYARCVEHDECPGHVVTTFALQAALYHLPLLSALTSYVYFEWRSGLRSFVKTGGSPKVQATPQRFHQQYPESMDMVREVFAGEGKVEQSIFAL